MRKAVVAVLAIWWLWPQRHRVDPELQVGVTRDGFVAREGRDIVRSDERRFTPDLPADFRVLGTRDGIAAAWKDKHEVALAWLADDGAIVETTHWGVGVDHFCDGVASNDRRFAVAWAQTDGKISFVHGPVDGIASVAPKSWCAIASAGENLALFWRDSGRTFLQFCGRTRCEQRSLGLPIERDDELIGYGCIDTACLLAVRHPRGGTDLMRLNARGQIAVRPLAMVGDRVSIVGTGDAFAIAYLREEGIANYDRVALDGTREGVYGTHARELEPPIITWARDELFAAYRWSGGVSLHTWEWER